MPRPKDAKHGHRLTVEMLRAARNACNVVRTNSPWIKNSNGTGLSVSRARVRTCAVPPAMPVCHVGASVAAVDASRTALVWGRSLCACVCVCVCVCLSLSLSHKHTHTLLRSLRLCPLPLASLCVSSLCFNHSRHCLSLSPHYASTTRDMVSRCLLTMLLQLAAMSSLSLSVSLSLSLSG